MNEIEIRALGVSPATRTMLSEILIETVANGGSVSFMHPLTREAADTFWDRSLAAADRGERVILGAWEGGTLIGTVTLLLDCPPNQPHRAEIAKMMTRPGRRGRGVGTALLRAAEDIAAGQGRTMLVLDTAADEGAAGFYEKQGYNLAGIIPDFAYKPHGGLTATRIYWKRIGPRPDEPPSGTRAARD
jgi:GNAT superfamily N-acetyltransferase